MSYEPIDPLLLISISSQIGDTVSQVVSEVINPSKVKIAKLVEAVESDPLASASIQLKAARAMQIMDVEYKHKDEKIQAWVRSNFENMEGNLSEFVGRMSSALPFGFAAAELILKRFSSQWKLRKFHYLDPSRVSFSAKSGKLQTVNYQDGGTRKVLPPWKVFNITNGLATNFGAKFLYGTPEATRAYPFIRLKQLLFGELGVTAKRLATGLLIGKADSNQKVQLLDKAGKPMRSDNGEIRTVSAVQNLGMQFKGLENNSYMVTDKNNDIFPIQIPAGEQFWNLSKMMIDEQIMRSFMIPDTIWQQGVATFGVGGLSVVQLNVLDSTISSLAQQIKDRLLERVIKPLIVLNFGVQSDYGDFPLNELKQDPTKDAALISNLVTVLSMGLVPTSDYVAVNMLREKLGLPPTNPQSSAFQADIQNQLDRLKQAPIPQPEEMEEMASEDSV